MIRKQKEIETLMSECEVYTDRPEKTLGGQQCGIQIYPTVIEHKELGIKISVSYYRSNFKNRIYCLTTMEKLLNDIIK